MLHNGRSSRLHEDMREVLERHRRICDEIYQLALEENQFLQLQKRPTSATLLDRKRALLDHLSTNLEALKTSLAPAAGEARELGELKEKVRQRILQIIHLDRENEKLILRYSLPTRSAPASATAGPPLRPAPGSIARLYGQVVPPPK